MWARIWFQYPTGQIQEVLISLLSFSRPSGWFLLRKADVISSLVLLLSGYRRKRQKGQSRQWVQRKDGRLCQTHAEFQRRLLHYGAGEELPLLLHTQTPTQHGALLEYHHVMFNDTMPLFILFIFLVVSKFGKKFPIYSSCQVYCEMWGK